MSGPAATGQQQDDQPLDRDKHRAPSRPGSASAVACAAPVLAVDDGALGFWKALREVFPDTAEQRCCWHKMANVLAALPKSAHPGAKAALAESYNAEDKGHARAAAQACQRDYGAKWPKAVAKVSDDLGVLLAGGSAGIQLCPLDAAVITDYLGGPPDSATRHRWQPVLATLTAYPHRRWRKR